MSPIWPSSPKTPFKSESMLMSAWEPEERDEEALGNHGIATLLKDMGGHLHTRGSYKRFQRTVYRFEQLMAERGRLVQIPMLFFLGFVQVILFGAFYGVFVWQKEAEDPRPDARVSKYIEGFWAAWTFMSDGGTHAKVYYDDQRFVGAFITGAGIIYLATVLAFVVDMVREQMDAMRVGKGHVHENGHIVVLNWTDRSIPLLLELCIASESEKERHPVVVMAKDSIEPIQAELAMQLPKSMRRGTKIVVRHGNPAVTSDLIKVSADRAAAVIVLAVVGNADESDSQSLRIVLSLKSMGFKMHGHVVAEVRDVDNEQLLQLVGGSLIETFVSHDVFGRQMLMSVRQLGLASVYDTMLGFEGNEFYIKAWPQLTGCLFGDLLVRFPEAIPIGICMANGTMVLNPPLDHAIEDGDEVIVIAEDEYSYSPCSPVPIHLGSGPRAGEPIVKTEKILMCGWRRDIRDVLKVLDCVVPSGSEVHMMSHSIPVHQRNNLLYEEGLDVKELQNITLTHFAGNTSVRRRLEGLPLEEYSACLIFADQAYEEDPMLADSHSLATLVLIRDIQASRLDSLTCPVTCEVLDARTHRMITKQKQLCLLSDFVQSNKFVARNMAMMAKQRNIKIILNELLGPSGNSILIVPALWVVHDGEICSFWTIAKRVAERNAILIGYQETRGEKRTFLNPNDKHEDLEDWELYDLAIIAGSRPVEGYHIPEMREDTNAVRSRKSRLSDIDEDNFNFGTATQPEPDSPAAGGADWLEQAASSQASMEPLQSLASVESNAVAAASSFMVRLAAKFGPLMSHDEQQRFGIALEQLGDLVSCSGLDALKKERSMEAQETQQKARPKSPEVPWSKPRKRSRSKSRGRAPVTPPPEVSQISQPAKQLPFCTPRTPRIMTPAPKGSEDQV